MAIEKIDKELQAESEKHESSTPHQGIGPALFIMGAEFQKQRSKIDWNKLSDRFFIDCIDIGAYGVIKISKSPYDLFSWFKKQIEEQNDQRSVATGQQ